MKRNVTLCCLLAAALSVTAQTDVLDNVCTMMGTGGDGRVVPVAAKPFGMVQLAPDTYFSGSGYHYSHHYIQGLSHTHKSGGGCSDCQARRCLAAGHAGR